MIKVWAASTPDLTREAELAEMSCCHLLSQCKAPATQGALQCSTLRKFENYYYLHSAAAAPCVNTLIGNSCFHLLHCIMQMSRRCNLTPYVLCVDGVKTAT